MKPRRSSATPAVLLIVALAVAGCSSGSKPASSSSSTSPHKSSSAVYTPPVDADAADIATHIKGCAGVTAGTVGKGGPAMTSTASCTLTGHLLIVDTWADITDSQISNDLAAAPVWYAYGSGWTAFLAEQGTTPATSTLQMQLTNDAAGLLKQAGAPPPPVAPATQHTIISTVAHQLSGSVGYAS